MKPVTVFKRQRKLLKSSHSNRYSIGNVANLGGVHSRQVPENEDGRIDLESIKDCFRLDNDDHFAETKLICLENSHNMAGGCCGGYVDHFARRVASSTSYGH